MDRIFTCFHEDVDWFCVALKDGSGRMQHLALAEMNNGFLFQHKSLFLCVLPFTNTLQRDIGNIAQPAQSFLPLHCNNKINDVYSVICALRLTD